MQSGRLKFLMRSTVAIALMAHAGFASSDAPSHAQQPTSRIFRCEANGKITFSDQPCLSTLSTEVVLQPSNSYHADTSSAPSRSTSTRREQSSKQSSKQIESIAAEQQRVKQQCQRFADQLTTIEIKLRSGYSAKQGEQLRERQRQLEQRRRTERCR